LLEPIRLAGEDPFIDIYQAWPGVAEEDAKEKSVGVANPIASEDSPVVRTGPLPTTRGAPFSSPLAGINSDFNSLFPDENLAGKLDASNHPSLLANPALQEHPGMTCFPPPSGGGPIENFDEPE
jgi:hypothetical protein